MSSFHLLPVKMKTPLLLVFVLASLLSIAHSEWNMDHEYLEIPKEVTVQLEDLTESERYLLTCKLILFMVNSPDWNSLSENRQKVAIQWVIKVIGKQASKWYHLGG